MKNRIWQHSFTTLLAALFFAACAGPAKLKPVAPTPPLRTSVPAKTPQPRAQAHTRLLFVIERNTNANVVHYEANLDEDGKLNAAKPVIAYWLMLAGDGGRKNLNWLEKKKAYGIKAAPAPSKDGYTLTLAAAPLLPLAVKGTGDALRAEVTINGRTAVLTKIFIQVRAKLLGPKVEYFELFGKDAETGEDRREKRKPG